MGQAVQTAEDTALQVLWISHLNHHVSFLPLTGYEEVSFGDHEELMAYAINLLDHDYRMG